MLQLQQFAHYKTGTCMLLLQHRKKFFLPKVYHQNFTQKYVENN